MRCFCQKIDLTMKSWPWLKTHGWSPLHFPPYFLLSCWINFEGQKVSKNISFSSMVITQAITWTTRFCLVRWKNGKRIEGIQTVDNCDYCVCACACVWVDKCQKIKDGKLVLFIISLSWIPPNNLSIVLKKHFFSHKFKKAVNWDRAYFED